MICVEEATAFVGSDRTVIDAILRGIAELHKLPDVSPTERAAWARVAAKRRQAELDELGDFL